MERNQPPIPLKSNSFSSSTGGGSEKLCHRNLSLGSIHFEDTSAAGKKDHRNDEKPEKIDEGEEEEVNADDVREESRGDGEETPHSDNLITLIDDIDRFLAVLLSLGRGVEAQEEEEEDDDGQRASSVLPEIPESTVEKFVTLVEKEIAKHESGEEKLSAEHRDDEPSLLAAVERISKLTDALAPFASNPSCYDAMSATGTVLHRAMSFLEDEFYSFLEECSRSNSEQGGSSGGSSVKTKRPPSFSRSSHDIEQASSSPVTERNPADYFPSAEALARLRAIADAMISAGYDTECRLVFATARRNAFKTSLSDVGFEKIAIDDVQRMGWDQMEGEIAKWIKAFRQSITASLPLERNLCCSVFAGHPSMADDIFYRLASKATHDLLNFSEAVAMARRSAEKLFKVLDMYEALRDMIPMVDRLFPCEGKQGEEKSEEEKTAGGELKSEESSSSAMAMALKSEMSAVNCRLGEAAVAIFCELENSIKSDAGKNAVPGGAVHPLTRYVMNYLKYACEYTSTLEQIFKDHSDSSDDSLSYNEESGEGGGDSHNRTSYCSSNNQGGSEHKPFEAQLTKVMDLLQSNLDSKAKLYKEVALNNIFLMNNGRYIVQKIKGSPEINELLGDSWCRKRSSDLRQYHKNYQRETWSKVLACFKDDGLTVKGSVHKPQLKERFKSFNALFDEIHRVQSTWVVSDEQLQSELRVSITAVVVPAYRSFLGRFQQYLDAGRQTEKYIKFAPEEVEAMIDDLFDGNAASTVARRRS